MLFMSFYGYSQTKVETENWIIDKINKYWKIKYNDGDFYGKSGRFYFSSGNIIVSEKGVNHSDCNSESVEDITTFPIWAIDKVLIDKKFYKFPSLIIQFTPYCEECTFIRDSDVIKRYGSEFCFVKMKKKKLSKLKQVKMYLIDSDPEKDFVDRFNKAITHLKTFYPKPSSGKKEPF